MTSSMSSPIRCPVATGVSSIAASGRVAGGQLEQAKAASTMLAMGATISARATDYSSSRRASSSTLMAEISASAASAASVRPTRRRTVSAIASGT